MLRGFSFACCCVTARVNDTDLRDCPECLSRCIKRWLRKGRAECPLCHWDVKSLFEASGMPRKSLEEELDARRGEGRERIVQV